MSDLTTLKNFSIIQIFKKNLNTFYYERKNKMKKIISAIIATAMMFTLCVTSTFAAESWREAFVTRLMKIMSSDPSYNQVVLTDLDRNGIPEAFVMRDGMDGGISAAFTMKGNTISNIDVPNNIIGTCLYLSVVKYRAILRLSTSTNLCLTVRLSQQKKYLNHM